MPKTRFAVVVIVMGAITVAKAGLDTLADEVLFPACAGKMTAKVSHRLARRSLFINFFMNLMG